QNLVHHQSRAAGQRADAEGFAFQVRAGFDLGARVDVVRDFLHVGGDDFYLCAFFGGTDHIVRIDPADGNGLTQHRAHDIGGAADDDHFDLDAVFFEHFFLFGDVQRPA